MRGTSSFLFVIYAVLISVLGISGLDTITQVSATEPVFRLHALNEIGRAHV